MISSKFTSFEFVRVRVHLEIQPELKTRLKFFSNRVDLLELVSDENLSRARDTSRVFFRPKLKHLMIASVRFVYSFIEQMNRARFELFEVRLV